MHWFFKFLGFALLIFLLYSFVFYLVPKIVPEKKIHDQDISGIIFENQIWSGIIRVKGDILTVPGNSITVLPGTKILVSIQGDKSNFHFLPWMLRNGINTKSYYHGVFSGEPFWDESQKIQIHFSSLTAIGTKEQPITIQSDAFDKSPYDFNAISIGNGVVSHAFLSNYRRLEITGSVTLRDSFFKDTGECAVCISFSDASIINNVFEKSLRESIYIYKSSPKIMDNLFSNLYGAGIRFDSRGFGSPVISHNTFEMPEKIALDIQSGGEKTPGLVSFNLFSGNSTIKIACDSKLEFNQNTILSVISFGGSGCGGSYIFGLNYWGAKNTKTILSERIMNKDKNFQVGIPGILQSPPQSAGRRIQ